MTLETLFDYTYPWLTMSLVGAAAVTVAFVAHCILFAVLRWVGRFTVIASTIVEYAVAPSRLVLPLIALQFVIAAAPADLHLRAAAAQVLAVMLIAALTWTAVRVIGGVGEAVGEAASGDRQQQSSGGAGFRRKLACLRAH